MRRGTTKTIPSVPFPRSWGQNVPLGLRTEQERPGGGSPTRRSGREGHHPLFRSSEGVSAGPGSRGSEVPNVTKGVHPYSVRNLCGFVRVPLSTCSVKGRGRLGLLNPGAGPVVSPKALRGGRGGRAKRVCHSERVNIDDSI